MLINSALDFSQPRLTHSKEMTLTSVTPHLHGALRLWIRHNRASDLRAHSAFHSTTVPRGFRTLDQGHIQPDTEQKCSAKPTHNLGPAGFHRRQSGSPVLHG